MDCLKWQRKKQKKRKWKENKIKEKGTINIPNFQKSNDEK